jgi:hypothetical protein
VLSLDDFVITNFVGGAVNTFPTWVYGATRIGDAAAGERLGHDPVHGRPAHCGLNLVASFRSSRKAAEGEVVGARAAVGAGK